MKAADPAPCGVLIVGGGPTGLFLACLLARRGVDVTVLERRARPSAQSRAIGLHPPALRALGEVGLAEVAAAAGARIGVGRARSRGRALGSLDFARAWPGRPFVLSLPQSRTEALLERRLHALAPTALQRGWEVSELQEDVDGVTVTARRVDGGGELRWRARVLVGADGSRSRVRELLGIGVRGREYPDTYLMGDLADPSGGAEDRAAVIHLEPGGVVESFPLPGDRRRWVVHTGTGGVPAVSPAVLTEIVGERTGTVLDPTSTTMISAFTVRRRSAQRLVTRRSVLLGDAACEISPIGGQGITRSWLDAVDLAPLLAARACGAGGGDLRRDPDWRRALRRIRRRARIAAGLAGANTMLGRPARASLAGLRAAAVGFVLRSPVRHAMAWGYSMGWVRRL